MAHRAQEHGVACRQGVERVGRQIVAGALITNGAGFVRRHPQRETAEALLDGAQGRGRFGGDIDADAIARQDGDVEF